MGAKFSYSRLPQLLRKAINFSASGDNTIISADTTHRITIHRIWLVCGGATNITFKDNLSTPAALPFIANSALIFDATGEPWFQTDKNVAFIINSSNAVSVGGIVHYSLEI